MSELISSTEPWIPGTSEFGARLALVRQHLGLGNVKEAALMCGVPAESWRSWERDHREPRSYAEVCRRISDRTGVNLAWLMGAYTPPPGLPHLDSNQEPIDMRQSAGQGHVTPLRRTA